MTPAHTPPAAVEAMPTGRFLARCHHSVVIDRPVDTLFDYVADARHQREWNRAVRTMEQVSPGPVGRGTGFVGDIKRVGRMSFEIVEYQRPRLIVHRAHPGMAEVGHAWTFTPQGRGTRLDQYAVMRPKGWGWLILPLLPLIVRRNTCDCAVSLRQAVEARLPEGVDG